MPRVLPGLVALTAVLLAAVLLPAVPAQAAQGSLDDPSGDVVGRGLDLTGAVLDNRQKRVVVDVDFVSAVRGDVIVSLDARGSRGLRLVSEHHPDGRERNTILSGSFRDQLAGDDTARIRCGGFRVRWSPDEPTVRFIMPAKCLQDGEYAALRFAVLTERRGDSDFAPDGGRDSGWVQRG